jgi:hypothetical protein
MADTAIWDFTDGVTANATDRIGAVRSPGAAGDDRYLTPAYIKDYILGLANTFTSAAPQITLGVNATTLGSIKMFGNTSGDLTLQPTAAAGTATVITFPATTGTAAILGLAQTWSAVQTFGANMLFSADNTHDIGASGATRPRDLFIGRNFACAAIDVTSRVSTATGGRFEIGASGDDMMLFGASYGGQPTLCFKSTGAVTWGSGTATNNSTADTGLWRHGVGTLGLRFSTTAQTFLWHGNYVSATDYHRGALSVAKTTLSGVTGATVTATSLIPDGALVVGVTTKITTQLGATGGTTGYQVGDGTDPDRWGVAAAVTAGTTTDNTNATATTVQMFTAANDVVLTADGGNFDGTGVIDVNVFYLIAQAD